MLNSTKSKTNAYDATAQVTRIEDGVMYVHIPGGVDETPVEMTISADVGDSVKVRVANGRAWVTGNQTAPPTDDTEAILAKLKAIQAEKKAQTATESAEIAAKAAADATTSAGIAGRAASVAQAAAEAAQATADSKKVVFTSQPTPPYHVGDLWVSGNIVIDTMSDGTNDLVTSEEELFEALMKGDGQVVVYYCIYARAEGEEFSEADWSLAATDDTTVNELREWFWHDSTGAHILGDETGYRNDLNSTGMHIIDTSTETEVARFAADGAQLGADTSAHTTIDAEGFEIFNADAETTFEAKNSGAIMVIPKTFVYNKTIPAGSSHGQFVLEELDGLATGEFKVYARYTVQTDDSGTTYEHTLTTSITKGTSFNRQVQVKVEGGWISKTEVYDGEKTYTLRMTPRSGTTYPIVKSLVFWGFSYDLQMDAPFFTLGTRIGEAGVYSVILGSSLYAPGPYQIVLGKFNEADETVAVCVGNGTDNETRSNAATLDWDGNVVLAGGLTANADSEVNGSISATGDIAAGGDATIAGDLSANSVTTGSDIDWTELTLDSACVAYSSVTVPHYKRRGDMVTVIGDVKPSAAVAAQSTLTIGQLPAECCPPQRISLLCQGSTTAVWYMQIATDGTITASRYRTEAGYQAMNTNIWLPFAITFMV